MRDEGLSFFLTEHPWYHSLCWKTSHSHDQLLAANRCPVTVGIRQSLLSVQLCRSGASSRNPPHCLAPPGSSLKQKKIVFSRQRIWSLCFKVSLLYQTPDLLSRSLVHIKNETNSHQGRHNFPNFALSVSNRKALGKRGMPTQVKSGCGSQHSHRLRLRLAGRGPNNSSLHPPLAAVAVVAGHSIARPIACGNRVPPQRTLA